MGLPGDDMYGIDLIIPDVTYLIKNRSRIRGSSSPTATRTTSAPSPMCSSRVNMPIYCTRFTAGLIKLKLEEHGLVKSTRLITVEPGKSVRAGKFNVEFLHVNHSIADSVAFAIHTHMGTIVHTGDFKIDSTPIDGEVIDLARFGELGKEGVLALLADSTNVERPGFTPSVKTVGATFTRQFRTARTGSSSLPSPPMSTGSSRCWTPPPSAGGRWPSQAAAGEHDEGLHGAGAI